MIEVGMSNEIASTVTEAETAKSIGSGSLQVYGTPAMIALMERAATELADKNLSATETTVGTHMDVKHTSATPIGVSVRAIATVSQVDGRRILYEVSAYDAFGEIGKGIHERFIVNREKFQAKALSKCDVNGQV